MMEVEVSRQLTKDITVVISAMVDGNIVGDVEHVTTYSLKFIINSTIKK